MKEISHIFTNANKSVIDSSKTKKINYNSKSFLKGLYKIKKNCEKLQEKRVPDYTKKKLIYDI